MKRKGILRGKENIKIIECSLTINQRALARKITFQFKSGMSSFAKPAGQSHLLSWSG